MANWNARVTEARQNKGLTKAALARECGVSGPTVTDWESGAIKTLEASNLLKICDVLGVDPWWLVLGKGKGKAPITDQKTPLSNEARKLILWVEHVDGLGDPARKFFTHIHAALQVASTLTQVQNSSGDAEMAGAEEALTSHIAEAEGKDRATRKHKP